MRKKFFEKSLFFYVGMIIFFTVIILSFFAVNDVNASDINSDVGLVKSGESGSFKASFYISSFLMNLLMKD